MYNIYKALSSLASAQPLHGPLETRVVVHHLFLQNVHISYLYDYYINIGIEHIVSIINMTWKTWLCQII